MKEANEQAEKLLDAMSSALWVFPYPHKEIEARRKVKEWFHGDEELAKAVMGDEYCTKECCLEAIKEHQKAVDNAWKVHCDYIFK